MNQYQTFCFFESLKCSPNDINIKLERFRNNCLWFNDINLDYTKVTYTAFFFYGFQFFAPKIKKIYAKRSTQYERTRQNQEWRSVWRFITYIQVIQTRRLKLAGHVFRDKKSPAHQLVTLDPVHGNISRGKPSNTFIDTLLRTLDLDHLLS